MYSYPLIVQGLYSGIRHQFLLVKIIMKFPFFRFLELRNEFYGIDLPHVGYFLCIIGQKPVQLSHWHCIIFLFLSSPAFVATFENGQYTWQC